MSETNFKIEKAYLNPFKNKAGDYFKLVTPNGEDFSVFEAGDVSKIKEACKYNVQNLIGGSISGTAGIFGEGKNKLSEVTDIFPASHNFNPAGGIDPETVDGARKGNCFKAIFKMANEWPADDKRWFKTGTTLEQACYIIGEERKVCFPDVPVAGQPIEEAPIFE